MQRSSLSHSGTGSRGRIKPRVLWLIGAGVLAVLTLAYIDGGEEPIRPIAETVTVPDTVSKRAGESQ